MDLVIRRARPLARRHDFFERFFADDWFWRPWRPVRETVAEQSWVPAVDVRETADEVIITAAVPGYESGDLSVSYEDGTLTIAGEQRSEDEAAPDDGTYLWRERRQGRFSRRIALGVRTTTESAEARYENGVLTIRVPKAPEAKATAIKVEAA